VNASPVILGIQERNLGRGKCFEPGGELPHHQGKQQLRSDQQAPDEITGGTDEEEPTHNSRELKHPTPDPTGIGKDTLFLIRRHVQSMAIDHRFRSEQKHTYTVSWGGSMSIEEAPGMGPLK
jgi:hypothetical protein